MIKSISGANQTDDMYVVRETKRALTGVAGKCKIFSGIDIGIPTGENSSKATVAP